MSLLVEGRGLALVRGGRLLVEGLDVILGPGEALHFRGPNGCGKSSLIRLIAGLLIPIAGTIDRAEAALADDHLALDRELPLGKALAFWRGPGWARRWRRSASTGWPMSRCACCRPARAAAPGWRE